MKKFITGWTRFLGWLKFFFSHSFYRPALSYATQKKRMSKKALQTKSNHRKLNHKRCECTAYCMRWKFAATMSSTFSMSERGVALTSFILFFFSSSHCLTWFQFIVCYASALDENPNNYKFSIHFNHCRRRWRPTHEHVWVYMICIRQMEYYAKEL